jgi:hypothetical protein
MLEGICHHQRIWMPPSATLYRVTLSHVKSKHRNIDQH